MISMETLLLSPGSSCLQATQESQERRHQASSGPTRVQAAPASQHLHPDHNTLANQLNGHRAGPSTNPSYRLSANQQNQARLGASAVIRNSMNQQTYNQIAGSPDRSHYTSQDRQNYCRVGPSRHPNMVSINTRSTQRYSNVPTSTLDRATGSHPMRTLPTNGPAYPDSMRPVNTYQSSSSSSSSSSEDNMGPRSNAVGLRMPLQRGQHSRGVYRTAAGDYGL